MIKRTLTRETRMKLANPKNEAVKSELVLSLGITRSAVNGLLRVNAVNGRLTTETALTVLEKGLKMSRQDILEVEITEDENEN
ncbi:MAG: hypothetical protein LBP85_10630 [Prevotellaceae bacterium]|jgi:hypothetical protein|nr:hypothetical protein [Prevotellaceae bacterium]